MAKLTKIFSGQTPTIRAAIKAADAWFDKENDLATQDELNAEFSDAESVPFPISLTVYKSGNTLTPYEFKKEKSTPCAGFVNLNLSDDILIEPSTVEENELDYNLSHTLDTRASNPFETSGVYWCVYRIFPKAGPPIVIAPGVELG